MLKPVALPPGRDMLATSPASTASLPTSKTMGIVEVAFFAARATGGPKSSNQIDLAADEIGGHRRQPVILAFGPAVFDGDVLPLGEAGFFQSVKKRGRPSA